MLVRHRVLLIAFLLVCLALPASAAERVDRLPEIRPATKQRLDVAFVMNNQQLFVGQGYLSSPTRGYAVLNLLGPGGATESTIEFITYDGTDYVRAGGEWYIGSAQAAGVSGPPPQGISEEDLAAGTLSKIGTMIIAGVPTDHYQLWLNQLPGVEEDEDASILYAKADLFIGQQAPYLHQLQQTVVGADPQLGEGSLSIVLRFYDFESANIPAVVPPANAKPMPTAGGGTAQRLVAPGMARAVTRLVSSPLVGKLAAEHRAR